MARKPRNSDGQRPAPVRPGTNGGSPARGTLVIIGGHEDKEDETLILRLVAAHARDGRLVVATVASSEPDELWKAYHPLFRKLGVRDVAHLNVGSREEAKRPEAVEILDDASVVFFTGGDQLKITSQLGDTPVYERIHEIYMKGGLVAGTSAGASVMCETMMVAGSGDASAKVGGHIEMAPGFGLFPGTIVDQHFAERGRIGRLIGAVAHNPRILGIGIDEDTAIVCRPDGTFEVLGRGAVYVADGAGMAYSNLTEESTDRTLSVFGICLHVLSMGDRFDLASRVPSNRPAEEVEEAVKALGETRPPARRRARAG
jgi:cyanophycinase